MDLLLMDLSLLEKKEKTRQLLSNQQP